MTQAPNMHSTVITVTHDGMGSATAPLQHQLLKSYFTRMLEKQRLPRAICFYAEGVKMVVEGSPVLGELAMLVDQGVHLLICRSCLEYYGLQAQQQLGDVVGMAEILDMQWGAEKVITL